VHTIDIRANGFINEMLDITTVLLSTMSLAVSGQPFENERAVSMNCPERDRRTVAFRHKIVNLMDDNGLGDFKRVGGSGDRAALITEHGL
jgi:hypothetical protein